LTAREFVVKRTGKLGNGRGEPAGIVFAHKSRGVEWKEARKVLGLIGKMSEAEQVKTAVQLLIKS